MARPGFTYALKVGQFGSHRMKLRDAAGWLPNHLEPDHPWILTADWTYVRFHGPRALQVKYVGRYGKNRLLAPAAQLEQWLGAGIDVYAYFNNDYDGHAVHDAVTLRNLLGIAWDDGQDGPDGESRSHPRGDRVS